MTVKGHPPARAAGGRAVLSRILATCAVVGLVASPAITDFASTMRKLCSVAYDHGDWEASPVGYWEQLFGDEVKYVAYADHVIPAYDPLSVGYVLDLPSCPDDKAYQPGVTTASAAKRAFYDAASMLKFTTCQETSEPSSKYAYSMYAVVHPEAIRCTGPDGKEWDRVQVLNSLGYKVIIRGQPVIKESIQSDYIRKYIDKDVGIRDLTKLSAAMSMEHHPITVMVDFSTLMLDNMDKEFDAFIASDSKAAYSLDYPDDQKTGLDQGPNTSFLMVKPSKAELANILDVYVKTPFDESTGWGSSGVVNFDGVLGTKGILQYYYEVLNKGDATILDRCVYSNDGSSPISATTKACRDVSNCGDCRAVSTDSIKVAQISEAVCGTPWECPEKTEWDSSTRSMCETFHKTWFTARAEYEKGFWTNGVQSPPSKTVFKPDVFLGYCSAVGKDGYTKMIYDKEQQTTTTTTTTTKSEQKQTLHTMAPAEYEQKQSAQKQTMAPAEYEQKTQTATSAPAQSAQKQTMATSAPAESAQKTQTATSAPAQTEQKTQTASMSKTAA